MQEGGIPLKDRKCRKSASFVIGAAVILSFGCKSFEAKVGCPSNGLGLKAEGFKGEDLVKGQVSFVFLGGPDEHMVDVVDYLYSQGVKATFFPYGKNVAGMEEQLLEAKRKSHLIGNGGFTGRPLNQMKQPMAEVRKADEAITPFVTGNIFLLALPDGSYSKDFVEAFNQSGLSKYTGPVQWQVGFGVLNSVSDQQCWTEQKSVGECAEKYLREIQTKGQAIVAFHSLSAKTLDLLKSLVPALKSSQFNFMRLDEVPNIGASVRRNGGQPGYSGSEPSCDDY